MRIAFMSSLKAEQSSFQPPKIHDIFEDSIEFWVAYPLSRRRVPHRPTLYLRERCLLAGLFQEMHDLIFPSGEQENMIDREFISAVERLSTKMQQWHQRLPFELQYTWPMCIATWELQFV